MDNSKTEKCYGINREIVHYLESQNREMLQYKPRNIIHKTEKCYTLSKVKTEKYYSVNS